LVLVCIRTLDRFFVLEGDDEGEERGRLEEEELLLVSTMMMGFEEKELQRLRWEMCLRADRPKIIETGHVCVVCRCFYMAMAEWGKNERIIWHVFNVVFVVVYLANHILSLTLSISSYKK